MRNLFLAVITLVVGFVALPGVEFGWNYLRAPRRILEAELANLKREQALSWDKRQIGEMLSQHYQKGLALKQFIIESDDSVSVDDCRSRYHQWRNSYFKDISEKVSIGKAQFVDSIPAVMSASILGMKSGETRRGKEALVLQIDARLHRFGEVLKDY